MKICEGGVDISDSDDDDESRCYCFITVSNGKPRLFNGQSLKCFIAIHTAVNS